MRTHLGAIVDRRELDAGVAAAERGADDLVG